MIIFLGNIKCKSEKLKFNFKKFSKMKFSIDPLFDSGIFEKNLDLINFEKEQLITFLRNMVLIRNTEYKIAEGRKKGLFKKK